MELSRQTFFIDSETQQKITKTKVLVIGVGLGSFVAEALARIGVSHLTFADGDSIELSNLNRQNYTSCDIGQNKALTLLNRLKKINPKGSYKAVPEFLFGKKLKTLIQKHDIIINTIDFDHPAFFECNFTCKKYNKIEIFPMNMAFGCSIAVSGKDSPCFKDFFNCSNFQEIKEKLISYSVDNMKNKDKFLSYLSKYKELPKETKDPQLGAASFLNAALISTLIYKISQTPSKVKFFPHLYQVDLELDL